MLSVLLPYRDAAATIEEAIASVLAQTEREFELVAIDDGSTDGSTDIVRRTARVDARVVPVVNEGAPGIAGALAAGLLAASPRARVVARMDADDVALPDRFEAQLDLLATDATLGVVGTQVEAFPDDAVGEGLRVYVAWQNALVTPEEHARDLFVESPLCHPSVMVRRDALESVGGWRGGRWPEDYDLFLRLAAAGWRMAKVPRVLLRWRHLAGRATFSLPEYGRDRLMEAKGHYLARRLLGRTVAVWGAGPTGRRMARALEPWLVRASLFVDIDPRKIGRTARGAPIRSPDALVRGEHHVVVAVGARGARALVREALVARGFLEGEDFTCVA